MWEAASSSMPCLYTSSALSAVVVLFWSPDLPSLVSCAPALLLYLHFFSPFLSLWLGDPCLLIWSLLLFSKVSEVCDALSLEQIFIVRLLDFPLFSLSRTEVMTSQCASKGNLLYTRVCVESRCWLGHTECLVIWGITLAENNQLPSLYQFPLSRFRLIIIIMYVCIIMIMQGCRTVCAPVQVCSLGHLSESSRAPFVHSAT